MQPSDRRSRGAELDRCTLLSVAQNQGGNAECRDRIVVVVQRGYEQAMASCGCDRLGCIYCLSGLIIATKALLEDKPKPSRADIVQALDDHLCRCGAHARIIRAVERAAEAMA